MHKTSCGVSRHFEVTNKDSEEEAAKIFSVPDFVGDMCKAIASRVRGAVAGVQFDDFHKVTRTCISFQQILLWKLLSASKSAADQPYHDFWSRHIHCF